MVQHHCPPTRMASSNCAWSRDGAELWVERWVVRWAELWTALWAELRVVRWAELWTEYRVKRRVVHWAERWAERWAKHRFDRHIAQRYLGCLVRNTSLCRTYSLDVAEA